ncbi:hypothetical protein [Burkholderia sp. PU8-34]
MGQGIDPLLRLQEPAPQNITTGEISRIHGALLKVTMNRSRDSSGVANACPNDREACFKLGFDKWWRKTRPSASTERAMYYGAIEIKVLR